MAMIVFVGLYLLRRGDWLAGALITGLSLMFMVNAGSKTALALTPIVVGLVLLPSMLGLRVIGALAAIAAIVGAHALTIGTVYVPALDGVLRVFHETTTFTGRPAIWAFAGDYVLAYPWTGFGFDGFWRTPLLLATEQPFDRVWDPRGIIHGHNGFLDVALFFGLPGLVTMIWLVVVAPAIDYVRSGRSRQNAALADLFFMIVVLGVLTSALESFYFRRADPVWLTMVIGLAGLRLTARLPLRSA